MKLEIGKKYRQTGWKEGTFIEISAIGHHHIFGLTDGDKESECHYDKYSDWIPCSEPELDDTRLWYWEFKSQKGWEMLNFRYTEKQAIFEDWRKLESLDFILKEPK